MHYGVRDHLIADAVVGAVLIDGEGQPLEQRLQHPAGTDVEVLGP